MDKKELSYKISFELFLFSPKDANNFIQSCLDKNLLKERENEIICMSEDLEQELDDWNKSRKTAILNNVREFKKHSQTIRNNQKGPNSKFNTLLKAFTDKGTLNRAVTVSDSAFSIEIFNPEKGIIKSKVKGTKEDSYVINMDLNKLQLTHNCHDYVQRKSPSKQFCKHLVKLFLILKEKDKDSAILFLDSLSTKIDKWEFLS